MCYYRQDAVKRQAAGIKFTQTKNQLFTPQRLLVAPIHIKLAMADGHLGPFGCTKFYLNWRRGWECGPQNINFRIRTSGFLDIEQS